MKVGGEYCKLTQVDNTTTYTFTYDKSDYSVEVVPVPTPLPEIEIVKGTGYTSDGRVVYENKEDSNNKFVYLKALNEYRELIFNGYTYTYINEKGYDINVTLTDVEPVVRRSDINIEYHHELATSTKVTVVKREDGNEYFVILDKTFYGRIYEDNAETYAFHYFDNEENLYKVTIPGLNLNPTPTPVPEEDTSWTETNKIIIGIYDSNGASEKWDDYVGRTLARGDQTGKLYTSASGSWEELEDVGEGTYSIVGNNLSLSIVDRADTPDMETTDGQLIYKGYIYGGSYMYYLQLQRNGIWCEVDFSYNDEQIDDNGDVECSVRVPGEPPFLVKIHVKDVEPTPTPEDYVLTDNLFILDDNYYEVYRKDDKLWIYYNSTWYELTLYDAKSGYYSVNYIDLQGEERKRQYSLVENSEIIGNGATQYIAADENGWSSSVWRSSWETYFVYRDKYYSQLWNMDGLGEYEYANNEYGTQHKVTVPGLESV